MIVIEAVILEGDVVVMFSDSKVSVCRAEEVYKYALSPELLSTQMSKESLPQS